MSSALPHTPWGRRRRIEEFADLLETGARSSDAELARLTTLARSLPAAQPAPRADFQVALRQRLVAVAGVQTAQAEGSTSSAAARVPQQRRWPARAAAVSPGGMALPWRAQRRTAVAVGAMAAVIAVGGVGVGSTRSLPGDPFYALKRSSESVELAWTSGAADRGALHLDFAHRRLDEATTLVSRSTSTALPFGPTSRPLAASGPLSPDTARHVAEALSDMDGETAQASRDLTEAFRDSGRPDTLWTLDHGAADLQRQLVSLMPALSGAARGQGQRSLTLLDTVSNRAQSLLSAGACSASVCANPRAVTNATTTDRLGVVPPRSSATTTAPGTSPSSTGGQGTPTPTSTPAVGSGSGSGTSQSGTGSGSGLPGGSSGGSTGPTLPGPTLPGSGNLPSLGGPTGGTQPSVGATLPGVPTLPGGGLSGLLPSTGSSAPSVPLSPTPGLLPVPSPTPSLPLP